MIFFLFIFLFYLNRQVDKRVHRIHTDLNAGLMMIRSPWLDRRWPPLSDQSTSSSSLSYNTVCSQLRLNFNTEMNRNDLFLM